MASTTAISAQTTAANSSMISIPAGGVVQAFVSAKLKKGEAVTIECTYDGGTNWVPVVDAEWKGEFLKQGVTRNVIAGPGDFRLVKSATSASIAVYYDS